ncbi:beta-ketoacyl synthase chain length factor [Desulforhopalus singaporensis]|uniref:Beta-ketoacyl synthase, N-terminal domain n=1 Tax=Desulforhopalus singaporensis TaxID=91360 RepID=A0A1H0T4U0_9BACT|nr:beta-ketoacyl synthase chain length factor [Desulforhopalus singaporensis]SDP49053.1 Beta-ketoacyl synthase, N-terminal domain [Desulforhopalus singaporensis]
MTVPVTNCFRSTLDNLTVPGELARQLRRADDFVHLGVTAGHGVLAGCMEKGGFSAKKTGMYLGSAFGPMQTNFEVLDQVVTQQPVSPILFSLSVFNTAAGYIASILGIRGCSVTLTDFSFPFFRALQQGMAAIESGMLDRCLVLQVETYSDVLIDGTSRYGGGAEPWPAGVVCWLLERTALSGKPLFLLEDLEIESGGTEGKDRLSLQETVSLGGKQETTPGYLGAAAMLSRLLVKEGRLGVNPCRVESLYGTVCMNIRSFEGV